MDRIITITRWLLLAFWRRFGRGGSSGSQGTLLIFSVLILVRYLVALHKAAGELAHNRPVLFETLLIGILLIWMFPLPGNASANVATRKH